MVKNILFKIWQAIPLIVAVIVIGIFGYFRFAGEPGFVNFEPTVKGTLNDVQKQTISIIIELNKYLVSLCTLMFGTIGFFLAKYKKEIKITWVASALSISLLFLGLTYYYAFRVYSRLTSELAQNVFAIKPDQSRILYYLTMEFWSSIGASIILLSIFIHVFSTNKDV